MQTHVSTHAYKHKRHAPSFSSGLEDRSYTTCPAHLPTYSPSFAGACGRRVQNLQTRAQQTQATRASSVPGKNSAPSARHGALKIQIQPRATPKDCTSLREHVPLSKGSLAHLSQRGSDKPSTSLSQASHKAPLTSLSQAVHKLLTSLSQAFRNPLAGFSLRESLYGEPHTFTRLPQTSQELLRSLSQASHKPPTSLSQASHKALASLLASFSEGSSLSQAFQKPFTNFSQASHKPSTKCFTSLSQACRKPFTSV